MIFKVVSVNISSIMTWKPNSLTWKTKIFKHFDPKHQNFEKKLLLIIVIDS